MKFDIIKCSLQDYQIILNTLEEYWGSNRTYHIHHPMFVREFADTSYAIKIKGQIAAYMFAFFSQCDPYAYVHCIGVHAKFKRRGMGRILYAHFFDIAKTKGYVSLRAITSPTNLVSINFHRGLGFNFLGEKHIKGVPVVPDYAGKGNHRAVMVKSLV